MRKLKHILLVLLTILMSMIANIELSIALDANQKRVIDSGARYFDIEECLPGQNSNSASGSAENFPLRLPLITDADRLAETIDKHIQRVKPDSPMNGLGRYFVQGGMRSGINPLLAVAQAQHESGFGTAGVATNGSKNAFGRTATSRQPHVSTNRLWYKWDSWEKSLVADAFPANGTTAQPDDWFQFINRVYQEELDDLDEFVNKYAPKFENDTAQYMRTVLSIANDIAEDSNGAIDITQFGSSAPSGGGNSTSPVSSGGRTVIALDPGHGGVVSQYTDPVTQLGDRETANSPEREDVLDVANRVKAQLEQASGYEVILLRTQPDEAVSKRDRVNRAKEANAAIAVSIHTDTTPIEEVWPQFVGGYRQNSSTRVEFTNQEVADRSNSYADIMVEERNNAQFDGGSTVRKVIGQPQSFSPERGLPSNGDLSLVQLWSDTVPWVYHESTAPRDGMSDQQKEAYATGIANGIKRAVPAGSGGASSDGCGTTTFSGGNLSETTLAYAWPQYHAPPYTQKKPEYESAISRASADGQYVGGGAYPGVDCGGFVTRLLIDSGFEPRYNFNGRLSDGASNVANGQIRWVQQNWRKLDSVSSTSELQPGDVAINTGRTHTFVFVGDIPGFDSQIASASFSESGRKWRAPMAGSERIIASDIEWYRKQ